MRVYIDINSAKDNPFKGEILSKECITEQSGYIDPKTQIEDMILAGRRLNDYRKAQYDFDSEEEIDETAFDPTRSGNFDLADATQAQIMAEAALSEQAQKASQTAPKGSQAVSGASAGGSEPPPENGA